MRTAPEMNCWALGLTFNFPNQDGDQPLHDDDLCFVQALCSGTGQVEDSRLVAPGRTQEDRDVTPSGEGDLENRGCKKSSLNCMRTTGACWPLHFK